MAALTDEATAELFDPGGTPLFAAQAALPAMPWKTDPAKGHLMGFVRDAAGLSGFDGATLTLTGSVTRSFTSDGTGFFGAVDLPVGSYTLTVSKPGFGSQVRTVTVAGTQVRQESFALGPPVLDWVSWQYDDVTRRASLRWTSETGQTFRVEYTDDLTTWLPHVTNLASGGLNTTYLTPAAPVGTTRRWWRVKRN